MVICSTTGAIVDMRTCQNIPNFYGWKSYDFLSEGKSYILSDIHHYHKSQDLLGFRQSRKYEASILKHKICGSTTGAFSPPWCIFTTTTLWDNIRDLTSSTNFGVMFWIRCEWFEFGVSDMKSVWAIWIGCECFGIWCECFWIRCECFWIRCECFWIRCE